MRLQVEVAVLGAGPAGCAAATVLARGGARVLIVDRARFPRDKVCGGAVLPDALALASRLGVADLSRIGHPVTCLRLRTARGDEMGVPLAGTVVSRRDLDARLLDTALGAGSEALLGATLTGASRVGNRVEAIRLATKTEVVDVEARAYVLATGAMRHPRQVLGLAGSGAQAAALRGYAELNGSRDDELVIAVLDALPGGYAWAFAAAAGVWNVGCGVFAGSPRVVHLRDVADGFLRSSGGRTWAVRVRGAPLETVYPRLAVARGNVLAVGDAAGLAKPMSGEGIGPALRSGVLAGECLVHRPDAAGVEMYRRRLDAAFRRDHRAWRFGEKLLSRPALVESLVRRARASPTIRLRFAGIVAGTLPATDVLSPLGVLRVFLGR